MEQNPIVSGSRNPDYKIEGRVFDCYAPTTSTPAKMISRLKEKNFQEQADRFVLNLDDTQASLADIQAQLNRYPSPKLQEIIVVRGGIILHFFP
ncbi:MULTISPECIES: CdiA C-terminal domain-containing protein [unclassified Microcoleus]|uniref:CdiA C-terminal domain-containing protein n=1 Tax=unclassified Microcoleus TaxID=2642155 RepID=UPI0040406F65